MRPETLLLRQVHPKFIQAGRVTSQAFRPTPKDEHHLSVDNGDRVTALDAWTRFVGNVNCSSVGVLAINCIECEMQSLPIIEDAHPYPEHCAIDFSALEKKEVECRAKVLARQAQARGWLYFSDLDA